jgi:hypothetical protein
MPVTADKPTPYSPAATILDVMARSRDRGLPTPVNVETLGRIGVPDSLSSRVLYTLVALDLIDENGAPTKTLEALRLAPEAEYKKRQEDWLRSAYADIFAIVDPSKDDETRVRDAFRGYNPVGQQARMVSLFLGLCANAGMIPEKAAPTTRPRAPSTRPAPAAASETAFTPRQRTIAKRVVAERFKNAPRHSPRGPTADLPAPLAGLLAGLPAEGDSWTAGERDKFLTTFKAVLDFCFPVVTRKANDGQDVTAVSQN